MFAGCFHSARGPCGAEFRRKTGTDFSFKNFQVSEPPGRTLSKYTNKSIFAKRTKWQQYETSLRNKTVSKASNFCAKF